MVIVHHLENSRSQRILWLLEELGIDYDIKHYARDPKTSLAPDSLREVHPLGRSPVVTDGNRTVAESGVIIDYLIATYGPQLRPDPGADDWLDYQYWLHYAEGSLMPLLLLKLVFDRISKPPMPLLLRPSAALIAMGMRKSFTGPRLAQHFDYLEGQLQGREWFLGDALSGADIQMSFPIEAAASRGGVLEGRPALAAWLGRVHAMPAYRRALEKGGPYEYGPAS